MQGPDRGPCGLVSVSILFVYTLQRLHSLMTNVTNAEMLFQMRKLLSLLLSARTELTEECGFIDGRTMEREAYPMTGLGSNLSGY